MRFRPSMGPTLTLALVAVLCVLLGAWQLERARFKRAMQQDFADAPVVEQLDPEQPPAPYSRVHLEGRFDPHRHILVDNRVLRGRPGVHVLTPFFVGDGSVTVLVNRGWLPMMPDRSVLPEVAVVEGPVRISGHLEPLRRPGLRLGQADVLVTGHWPQLATYPDLDRIAAVLETPLYPLVLYLAEDSPGGFEGRQWQPYTMGPEKHRGYALQWFTLALVAVISWIALGVARGRENTP